MVAKKVPMRQCTGCREMKSKRDMIRVIKTAENEKRPGCLYMSEYGLSEAGHEKPGIGAVFKNSHTGNGLPAVGRGDEPY